ncbi:MAG TPA: dockerin type I domain-containing protein [Chthoniobacterales bacterium]|jgi:hypothetical protein|nr:dockerin type I domain-containing protein [Chthoniobacterales bacterium]
MKKKKSAPKSAFFNLRTVIGFVLVLGAVFLALLASGLISRTHTQRGTGASAALSKVVGDPARAPIQPNTIDATPHNDARGVEPVHTRPLRELPMIPPDLAPHREAPEPIKPPLPPDSPEKDTAHQSKFGAAISAPTATGVSFEGVGVGIPGFVPSSNPPDTNGRVGATQYVQWNNTSFAVFSKTGTLLYGPAAGNTLFQSLGGVCATHNDGDPVVAYDIMSGRWILSQFVVSGPAGSASHQCVAVSQTQDATGAYYLYDFLTDGTNFVDYPKIGVWPDAYYMSAHVFNAAGTSFLAGRVYAFERPQMIQGLPARSVSANLPAGPGGGTQFGFLPADLDSLTPPPSGEAEFIIGPDPNLLTAVDSTRATVNWGVTPSLTLSATTSVTIPNGGNAPCTGGAGSRACVPEPAPATTADYLDNLSGHLMYRLAYRNFGGSPVQESLVANATHKGATTRDDIQWYEFRNAGASNTAVTVFQAASWDPDTSYRWMGSIAMDNSHNIALGYSKSSTAIKPGIFITGRLSTDTINTMGAEATVFAGTGVQTSGGNRWGDYSAMTLDPVDQCTFWYTNEYIPTNGNFNWAARIASYSFGGSCTPAPAWGTLSGTVTSCATGAPISGVNVALNNGFAAATDSNGNYSILVPAGSYTATATDPNRNCTSSTPTSAPVTLTSGATSMQNFCMNGTSNLQANGFTIDDTNSGGNGNGVVNKNECINVNLGVKNNGCASETGISATVTTSTAGVTVTQGNATYPNMVIDASGLNSMPFKFQTSNSFVCGTNIVLNLNLTYASGSKTITYSVPTCSGGPNQTIPANSIASGDLSQPDRLGRTGNGSTCSGKACPGAINTAGTRNYKTFTFTNSGGAPACITINTHAACGSGGTAGDIISAAYLNTYTPPVAQGDAAGNLCKNYLGDSGISGLGTTVSNAAYTVSVPAGQNLVVVVETATGGTTCAEFDATLSGFFDFTSGPGLCPPNLLSAASRFTHGAGAGTFDLTVYPNPNPSPSPSGTPRPVVEPRTNFSNNYTIVFNFDQPVTTGSAMFTGSGGGSVSGVTLSGNSMIVGLTGVTDQQTGTVTISGVAGPGTVAVPSTAVQIGFLIGDVTQDGTINVGDTAAVRGHAGVTLDNTNFQYDVNTDGAVNVGDTTIVRNNSGHFVP